MTGGSGTVGGAGGNAIPSDGGPLVYVDDLSAPRLDDTSQHHLARVRRVADGDPIVIGDGRGTWRRARMAGDQPEPDGAPITEPALEPELTIAFGLSKGDKPEWTIQKLTEIGIDRIIVFAAARSIVRWDDRRRTAAHERFRRIAREAGRQSRRATLPIIEPITDFATVAARPGAVLAERGGRPPTRDDTIVLIGPEGGWDPAERTADLPAVALASGVLRAETAAIVAGGLLTALRQPLVSPIDASGPRPGRTTGTGR